MAELLKNLDFSYQKARFVSDHLDEGRREHWRAVEWPAILRTARRRGALLLFGDEASFAQWGEPPPSGPAADARATRSSG